MAELKMRYRKRQNPNSAGYFTAISKSDTVNYVHPDGGTLIARGLYIGGAGSVVAVNVDGEAVTFAAVPAGTQLAIDHIRVNSSSTTATNMVRLD